MLDTVLIWIDKNRGGWLEDLKPWLRLASVSADPAHQADLTAAADWAMHYMRAAGLEPEWIPTARHPCILARTPGNRHKPDAPHILFYGHYDVQPADPLDKWITPPFEPTIRDGKIFARGASDDKGQVFCHLAALMAWKQIAGELPVRMTVLLEGEEEIGSMSLEPVITQYADELKTARALIVSDSNQLAPGVPTLTTGFRGMVYYQVEVAGAAEDLHSGVYGGAVANPANALVGMLGALHDVHGRVTIPGFYDEVVMPEASILQQWRRLPFDEAELIRRLGVSELFGEKGFSTLERRWCRPTLDINGLTSGYQGPGAKTVLPGAASAKVSMRLVPRQDPLRIAAAFETYLGSLKPAGVRLKLQRLNASPAVLTPTDSPAVAAAAEALEIGFGQKPVFTREGGTVPVVSSFKKLLDVDSVLIGFGLPDDNLHAPNEKFDLASLYGGMRTAAALYDRLGRILSNGRGG